MFIRQQMGLQYHPGEESLHRYFPGCEFMFNDVTDNILMIRIYSVNNDDG